jgi:hypothetical protein
VAEVVMIRAVPRVVAPRVESLGLLDVGVAENGVPVRIEIVVGSTQKAQPKGIC